MRWAPSGDHLVAGVNTRLLFLNLHANVVHVHQYILEYLLYVAVSLGKTRLSFEPGPVGGVLRNTVVSRGSRAISPPKPLSCS